MGYYGPGRRGDPPSIELSLGDYLAGLRRSTVDGLRSSAQELRYRSRMEPDPELDPGRVWSATWLESVASALESRLADDEDRVSDDEG